MIRIATLVAFVATTTLLCAPRHAAAADDPGGDTSAPRLVDVGDLWKHVRHGEGDADAGLPDTPAHQHFFVAAPTITSKPSTGLTAGLSSNLAFVSGDPSTTHISSISGGLKVSMKKQTLASMKFAAFTAGDRWFVQGDGRLWWTSLNSYPLGTAASASGAERLQYDWFRTYDTAYRQVGPRLFVGAGINFSDHRDVRAGGSGAVDRAAYSAYSARHDLVADGQISSGTNVGLLFDTRDSGINASHGWFANTTYRTFFSGFMGGSSTWQQLSFDARTYRPLTRSGRQKLAFWMLGDFVTGGTAPYLDLPATGTDGRSARGYGEGRYRGPHLLYGEVEYRATVVPSGLFGLVAFANTTTIDGDTPGEKLFRSYAPAAGLGLRVLMNKHSKTNLCADYGVGKQGSHGLYLAIQEAF